MGIAERGPYLRAAGRSHDAAASRVPHDQRLVSKARIVTFLHRRVECVAIDMRDGQGLEFRMKDEPS